MALRVVVLVTMAVSACALDNGLGRLPQMGYNTWYDLECGLESEAILKETVDAVVNLGLRDLGYRYFNLDDCWAVDRMPNGTVIADPKIFPSSTLKPLADYVHSKNMLFGTYTDRGTKTCAGRPAALGHEQIDANTYAAWGVDYLKEDSCNAVSDHGWNEWYAPVGQSLGNSWRIGPDDTNWAGVLTNIDINSELASYSGPGGWNDPCLLLAATASGELRMTEMQTRTQFNFWAIMAAPLLISANVRNMSSFTLATYSNRKVIAVNQDALAKQGFRVAGGNFTRTDPRAVAVTACNKADPLQQWQNNTPASGYFFNAKTSQCLNVDDCGTTIIHFSCVTTGGTCCGADCYDNMKFELSSDGTLRSPVKPGACATIATDSTVSLQACSSSSPKWSYNETTQQLASGNICLTMAQGQGVGTNVWARPLASNAWALLFANVGPTAMDVTCDASCFQRIGLPADATFTAEDLWTNATQTISTNGFTVKALAAAGGSSIFKLTAA